MEWTGQQQIQFLLRSFLLGCLLGFLLDILTGLVRISKHSRWLWTDVLFGPLAAVITFCGALVIMDGQLHPLLFCGIALGMLTEHVTVGTYCSKTLRRFRRLTTKMVEKACRYLMYIFIALRSASARWRNNWAKSSKNTRKS